MTIREFICVECGKSTFVEFGEQSEENIKKLQHIAALMYCAFCGDNLSFKEDHNLSVTPVPKSEGAILFDS